MGLSWLIPHTRGGWKIRNILVSKLAYSSAPVRACPVYLILHRWLMCTVSTKIDAFGLDRTLSIRRARDHMCTFVPMWKFVLSSCGHRWTIIYGWCHRMKDLWPLSMDNSAAGHISSKPASWSTLKSRRFQRRHWWELLLLVLLFDLRTQIHKNRETRGSEYVYRNTQLADG